jgi:hypothetical protein
MGFQNFLVAYLPDSKSSMVQAEDSWSSHKLLQMPDCPRAVLWRLFVHEVSFFFRLISLFLVKCCLVLLLDKIKHRIINYAFMSVDISTFMPSLLFSNDMHVNGLGACFLLTILMCICKDDIVKCNL